jgi:hypothetical protein
MKGGMLPFVVALALACDLPGSHAGGRPPRLQLLHAGLLTGEEAVVGRAHTGGKFLLLTSARRIVEIDVAGGIAARRIEDEGLELWSLAAAPDGSLWSLAGRDTLVEIPGGEAARRLPLDGAYAAVHSGPGYMLYQPYDFRVGTPALLRGGPAHVGEPAGLLKVAGGGGRRVAVWMKSLVQCGFVLEGRIPCWPVGLPVVDVLDARGNGRLVPLDELSPAHDVSGEEFAERGRPLLQDVALDGAGALWVLASPPGAPALRERGVRDLWRFSAAGRRLDHHRLDAPLRMLIVAAHDRLMAIAGNGSLVRLEVR